MLTIEISVLIGLISLAFALYSGMKKLRRDDTIDIRAETTAMTTVIVKLENISIGITELKTEFCSIKEDVKLHGERLTKVEESTKSAHRRLDNYDSLKQYKHAEQGVL